MTLGPRPRIKRCLRQALALVPVCAITAWSGPAQSLEDAWKMCVGRTAQAERAHTMPAHLLTAVSKVESGRWHRETGEILAWPWTVTSGGEGRFFPSKKAAIAEVRRLQGRGVRNIDVGCMQVNLRHHPRAFDSLEAAFDPDQNVAYAVRFLLELKDKWGSWTRAVGNYHSNTPQLNGRYRLKVFRMVYAEKRRAAQARRAARLAALKTGGQAPGRPTAEVLSPPRLSLRP